MSQARKLSTGRDIPGRRPRRQPSESVLTDHTVLRRLLQAEKPDLDTYAAVLKRYPDKQSSVYVAALERYTKLAEEAGKLLLAAIEHACPLWDEPHTLSECLERAKPNGRLA